MKPTSLAERLRASGGETGALIAACDWSATPLGPIAGWPRALQTAVELMIGAKQPVYVAWGPDLLSLYNDGYLPIVGTKHPGIGLPFRVLWAEIWDEFEAIVANTMAGEAQHFVDRPIALAGRPGLGVGYFTFSYTPLRDDTGAVAGFYCAATETTDTVLADRRRAAELERQRAMFRQAPGFICTVEGPDHVFSFVNAAHERLFGDRGLVGRSVRAGFPELAGQGYFEMLDRVFATGERVSAKALPARLRTADGGEDVRYLDFVFEPMRDADGGVFGIFCEGFDVTDAHLAQAALERGQARLRFLADLAEATQPLTDPAEVMAVTARLLGRHLGAAVCAYADVGADQDSFMIRGDWTAPGARSIVGRYSLDDFGPTAAGALRAGKPFVTTDTVGELGPAEAALFLRLGLKATVCMPLVKEGRLTALMAAHAAEPRIWTESELALLAETVERCWAHVERVGTEAALRASDARYRQLFDTIDEGFCVIEMIFDPAGRPVDYRFLEANPAFPRHTGLVDAVGRTVRELVPGIEERWLEIYGRVATTGEAVRFESGSEAMERWFEVHASRTGPPEARRVAILFHDITERRLAEARLRASEAQLRELNVTLEQRVAEALAGRKLMADLVETTDAFVQAADREFRWLTINRAAADEFERIFGKRPRVGLSMLDLLADAPEHQAAVRDVWGRALAGEEFTEIGEFGDPGRDRRWYEMKYHVLRDAGGEPIGAYQFVYDVTDRIREQQRLAETEAARREADALYRAYFENSPEALFVIGVAPDGTFTVEQLNPAHEAGVGFRLEDVRGRRIEEILPAPLADQVLSAYRHVLATGAIHQYREVFELDGGPQHWDTSLVPVRDAEGRITRLIGSSRNVTRQVMAEEALRQAQKMEAVGQLTGGIAHDFNNLLGAVVGAFDLIRRRPDDPSKVRRYAEAGLEAAERGAKLTGQLLAFSRVQRIELRPLVVADLVRGMGDLLARTLGPMVRLGFDLEGDGAVLSDPTQLEMAVLNLAINARDAMPDGGDLVIATRVQRTDGDAELSAGDYVELSVADTGSGMPPEVSARALDPFFTTKGPGKGTGLGLSQVYGIARQAGGTVRIESRPGVGTTVRVYLPRTAETSPRTDPPDAAAATTPDRSAAILVVDDDPDVRRMLVASLEALGYRVRAAASGPDGLAALEDETPDLMMVDFAMPGMNGAEMARAARDRRPDLPIVFASGYADTSAIEAAIGPEATVLRKPFRVNDLQAAVAAALSSRS